MESPSCQRGSKQARDEIVSSSDKCGRRTILSYTLQVWTFNRHHVDAQAHLCRSRGPGDQVLDGKLPPCVSQPLPARLCSGALLPLAGFRQSNSPSYFTAVDPTKASTCVSTEGRLMRSLWKSSQSSGRHPSRTFCALKAVRAAKRVRASSDLVLCVVHSKA